MPKPKKNESEKDFVARCIPIIMNEKSNVTNEQASGKCFGLYQSSQKAEKAKQIFYTITKGIENLIKISETIESINELTEVSKAITVDGFESPEPGDLPAEGAKMLAKVYASCRKDGGEKEKCAKIAWSAVDRAGYKSENISGEIQKLNAEFQKLMKLFDDRYKNDELEKALPIGTRRKRKDGIYEKQGDGTWKKITEAREEKPEEKKLQYDTHLIPAFINVRDKMVPPKYKVFVTEYTTKQYKEKNAKTFLSGSGKSGYAIASDGDLISVFSAKGANEGNRMIDDAIKNGAKKLDCLGERLRGKYEEHGFIEDHRDSWSDEYAPEGWDYNAFNRPDVIYMKIKEGGKVEKSQDKEQEEKENKKTKETLEFTKFVEEYVNDTFGDDEEEEEGKTE